MKTWILGSGGRWGVATVAVLAALMTGVPAARANPFSESPLFKKLVGEWEGRGEGTDAADKVSKIIETWSGKWESESAFVMSGIRNWGDDQPHNFQWRFLYNPATELIECEMTMSTLETTMRFEVQTDEAAGTITLKAPLGDSGELTVVNRIVDGKILGEFKLVGDDGKVSLSGSVEHRRPKAWEEKGEEKPKKKQAAGA